MLEIIQSINEWVEPDQRVAFWAAMSGCVVIAVGWWKGWI